MKILVLSLSSRNGSQSYRVSEYLANRLKNFGQSAEVVSFYEHKLSVYDDSETGAWQVVWQDLQPKFEAADGFIAVSPEWNGMAAPAWFNLIHYVRKEMAHKPVMLVGVSSGRGGSYPLAQMKQAGQKNRQFVISPESLIVGDVKNMLLTEVAETGSPDELIRRRADYALKILIEYAKALEQVRKSGIADFENFANGV